MKIIKQLFCSHSWNEISDFDWINKVGRKYGGQIGLSLDYLNISNLGHIAYECKKCDKIVVKNPREIMFTEYPKNNNYPPRAKH